MALGLPNTGGFGLFSAVLAAINGSSASGLYVALVWALIQLGLWSLLACLQLAMIILALYLSTKEGISGSVKGTLLRTAVRNIV